MRMSVRVVLALVGAMFFGCLLVGPSAASAAAAPLPVAAVDVHAMGLAPMAAPTPAAPTTSAPDINKEQQAADASEARTRLIMAVVCIVLLVIVYFGHKAKYKHLLRLRNLQNAKG
jgi:hypothetical protein